MRPHRDARKDRQPLDGQVAAPPTRPQLDSGLSEAAGNCAAPDPVAQPDRVTGRWRPCSRRRAWRRPRARVRRGGRSATR
ncbi:hypothetical protein ACFPRL_17140 [Pseudoclavibacter helvolus]